MARPLYKIHDANEFDGQQSTITKYVTTFTLRNTSPNSELDAPSKS